jgi:hypothetical protein
LIPILSKMPGGRAAPGAGPHQTRLLDFDGPVRVRDIRRLQSFVKRVLKASLDLETTGTLAVDPSPIQWVRNDALDRMESVVVASSYPGRLAQTKKVL